MAQLLYRLGRFAATKPWVVIVAWVVILAGAVGAFSIGSGNLSTEISLPNTPTAKVTERLQKIVGDGAAAPTSGTAKTSGTIVLQTRHGDAFTGAQREQIARAIHELADSKVVDTASDPFVTAAQLEQQRDKIAAAQRQIVSGETTINRTQHQLDMAKAAAHAPGAPAEVATQLQSQQDALTKRAKELKSQKTGLALSAKLLGWTANASSISDDRSTAIIGVTLSTRVTETTPSDLSKVRAIVHDAGLDGISADYSQSLAPASGGGGETELVGLVVAAIVLVVMLGALIAAGLPLLTAVSGVAVSYLLVMSTSKIFDVNAATPLLALMLGLAVGIDYTLFILNRHRSQVLNGMRITDSVALANGTSGSAVVFAGITVVVTLLALNFAGISFIGTMGTAAAVAVAVAVAVSITLTPALLGMMKHRILPKRAWRKIALSGAPNQTRAKPMSTKRAWTIAVASIVVLGIIAIPATQMRLSLGDGRSAPLHSTEYQAWKKTHDAFGAGYDAQLTVLADLPKKISKADLQSEQVRVGEALERIDHVAKIAPIAASDKYSVAVFQIQPTSGGADDSTEQLVNHLRTTTLADGVKLSVAGNTSANIDISEVLTGALTPYLIIVISISILLMIAVFRSLLVPIIATGGFVLSLFAAFGAITAIYQLGWFNSLTGVHDPAPILSLLPTLVIGILFGLAMDYMLFIGTGIREAFVHGADPRAAVAEGLRAGRSVVTAAALIMASVFAGFILNEQALIGSLGFALAFGVLADAFVVRMLLIPALLHILGRSAWWLPRWLDRIIPNVDVEGATLQRSESQAATSRPDTER